MNFNDAFFNMNYVTASADITFSPSNLTFTNLQVTQQLIAKQTGNLTQQLDETIAGYKELVYSINDWSSNHLFVESELRIDYGLQGNIEGKIFGIELGGGIEDNTKPLVQLNVGYNNQLYGRAYPQNRPTYGYGNVNDTYKKKLVCCVGGRHCKKLRKYKGNLKF